MLYWLPLLAQQNVNFSLNLTLSGLVALIAGILILVVPRLLNYIVAVYLIVIGLVQLFRVGA
jgi:cytochrome c biogenesis protein CcdA